MVRRQIVLDTETTGLDPLQGHRIIEIGCVELVDRRASGRTFHQYLQPDREIDPAAFEVHGISLESLRDRPRFGDIADEFMSFVREGELIIHNAPFDVGFLDNELRMLGGTCRSVNEICTVVDTLALARELHPGQKNSLDALCKRYSIDNSQRQLHGALLDAEILADLYLAMTGGQSRLELEPNAGGPSNEALRSPVRKRLAPTRILRATAEERDAHEAMLRFMEEGSGERCGFRLVDDEDLADGATGH